MSTFYYLQEDPYGMGVKIPLDLKKLVYTSVHQARRQWGQGIISNKYWRQFPVQLSTVLMHARIHELILIEWAGKQVQQVKVLDMLT